MARTKAQYENEIRTIVVAKVISEFRKARIIERIRGFVKMNNNVYTGALAEGKDNTLFPNRDDQWLINKESVEVVVTNVDSNGLPDEIIIKVTLDYGVNYKYLGMSKRSKTIWQRLPNGYAIQDWVEARINAGGIFLIEKTKDNWVPARRGNASDRNRAAYMIARKIKAEGITKTNFDRPFNEVEDRLNLGLSRAEKRIVELYESSVIESIDEIMFKVFS